MSDESSTCLNPTVTRPHLTVVQGSGAAVRPGYSQRHAIAAYTDYAALCMAWPVLVTGVAMMATGAGMMYLASSWIDGEP